eukprot:6121594-Prymnesium_polylepis.1
MAACASAARRKLWGDAGREYVWVCGSRRLVWRGAVRAACREQSHPQIRADSRSFGSETHHGMI